MLTAFRRWMQAGQDAPALSGGGAAQQRELAETVAGFAAELMRVDLQVRPEERAVADALTEAGIELRVSEGQLLAVPDAVRTCTSLLVSIIFCRPRVTDSRIVLNDASR